MAVNSNPTFDLLSEDEIVNKQLAKLHGGTWRFKTLARLKLSMKDKFNTATRQTDVWTTEDEKRHEVKVFITNTKSLLTAGKWEELVKKGTTHLTIDDNNKNLKSIPKDVCNIQTLRSFTLISSKLKAIPDHLLQMKLNELRLDGCHLRHVDNIHLGRGLLHLELTNAQLKAIPLGIGDLTTLEVLDLTGNQLSTLPASLANLTALGKLKACGNRLTELESCISGLASLRTLDLSQNHIGRVPEQIGDMSGLAILRLSHNSIKELPASFSGLRQLTHLYLGNNCFVEVPDVLAELPNLEALNMVSNALTTMRKPIRPLKILLLNSNRLSQLPNAVTECENLEILQLAGNELREIPPQICRLTKLRNLQVDDNPLSILPKDLCRLHELRHLSLRCTKVWQLPSRLSVLRNLRFLDLDQTEVNEKYRRTLNAPDTKQLMEDLKPKSIFPSDDVSPEAPPMAPTAATPVELRNKSLVSSAGPRTAQTIYPPSVYTQD